MTVIKITYAGGVFESFKADGPGCEVCCLYDDRSYMCASRVAQWGAQNLCVANGLSNKLTDTTAFRPFDDTARAWVVAKELTK